MSKERECSPSKPLLGGGYCPQIPSRILSDRVLVHQVLLTDPERFNTLTVSGKPRMLQTPSFNDFSASLDSSHDNNSNNTLPSDNRTTTTPTSMVAVVVDLNKLVNGAFRHEVCQRINQSQSLAAAHDLLLDLHDMLRSLIPSRPDLHKLLVDDAVVRNKTDSSMTGILLLVIQAAQALQALESEARATSTNEWIHFATAKVHHGQKEMGNQFVNIIINPQEVSYLVTSIMYLLFKAESCQIDKQNFYLSHVWATEILKKGPELERINFETEFGSFSNSSTAPATRTWIRMLVEKAKSQQQNASFCAGGGGGLNESAEKQRCDNLVRVGWVESILFHSPPPPVDGGIEKSHLLLPEIFSLDQGNIQAIRRITRLAAAGSALALHACQVAGQPVTVLNNQLRVDDDDESPSSPIHLRRTALVHAMSEQWKPQKIYEQDVTTAVLALAKEWKSSPLDQEAIDVLSRRTTSVLQAQDSVLQILDGRMKECFRQAVLMIPELIASLSVPTKLQTGRGTTMAGAIHHTDPLCTTFTGQNATVSSNATAAALDIITKKLCDLFCSRGLSFYAFELSMAAKMASRIVELALQIYGGNVLLDRIIL